MGQYYMDLVHSRVDGSRPHNRPDSATRDEMQCSNPLSNKPRKKFDYADVEFAEKETRPGCIPVTFVRGGPYSLGICKWHGETGTHFRTHNVAYSRLGSKTSEAQALRVISMHWPGCDSLDKINWIRSHTPVCMNNLDITLFPAMKTPAIHDAETKTKYR